MLKYRIFFVGYGGAIYDAYKNNVINVDVCENTPEEVASILKSWEAMNELRTDLEFVIMPIYKAN